MLSPRPKPLPVRAEDSRVNGRKMVSNWCSATPSPWSSRQSHQQLPSRRPCRRITPPSGECRMALRSRFSRAWASALRLPRTTQSSGRSLRNRSAAQPLSKRAFSTSRSHNAGMEMSSSANTGRSVSIQASSRVLSTSCCMPCTSCSRRSRRSCADSVPSAATCRRASGVRSSWERSRSSWRCNTMCSSSRSAIWSNARPRSPSSSLRRLISACVRAVRSLPRRALACARRRPSGTTQRRYSNTPSSRASPAGTRPWVTRRLAGDKPGGTNSAGRRRTTLPCSGCSGKRRLMNGRDSERELIGQSTPRRKVRRSASSVVSGRLPSDCSRPSSTTTQSSACWRGSASQRSMPSRPSSSQARSARRA